MNLTVFKYVVFLVGVSVSYAQDIYVETSLSSASFDDFKSDDGVNTLDNKYSRPVEFGIGVGAILNVTDNNRLKWDLGLNFNKYKINTSLNTSIPTEYNLNYVSLKTGPYFSLINHSRVKLQLHAHSSLDHLIFGSNQYSDVYDDLLEGKNFSKLVMNYHYGVAVEITLSNSSSLYMSYDSKNGLTNSIDGDESYRLNATSILMGFRFKLNKL
ncbi:hypothetical protein FORMB_21770 [Formosa sp. Hel1_33_131]|uniref:hypothetical protein n=1 Tax=Formosa sp. Hel1_33_131 TaxID=1336794 RepID=UPI00084E26F9|nr:hypothetical protein [Formosa sp. Hel1_33_131]AOR29200.1 hypothetical protein FORMB_21770 [Formosa sp. Hel1_33_131]